MNPTPPQNEAPFPIYPVHPDLLEYAKQTFDMEEFIREMAEIKAGNFRTLEEVIAEIEAMDHRSRDTPTQFEPCEISLVDVIPE